MRHLNTVLVLLSLLGLSLFTGCEDSYSVESFKENVDTSVSVDTENPGTVETDPEDNSGSGDDSESVSEENDTENNIIYVYVCGAVKNPDVYELPPGSLARDAIEMAGGLTESAAVDHINPARRINDGERVYVPYEDDVQNGTFSDDIYEADANDTDAGKININTAGKEELLKLPGIGNSKAESIIAYREEHGAFSDVKELMNVSGIGEGIYEKLKDKVTVR